jgi:putative nucleotidyltransferase with HDIG domain
MTTMTAPHGLSKQPLHDKAMKALEKDMTIPAFSGTAQKLMSATSREEISMEEIGEIVMLDPGLSSKYLRMANSVAFGGKSIKSIQDALVRLGMAEVRRVASAIGVVDRFSRLKIKVDWNLFWLHNLLTARLTETLADAYQPVAGKEYLAGLLHDVGKLFLEHYFPQEFEAAIQRAMERRCGVFEAENQLFDVTHAEIGFALCEKWNLHKEITRAVRFHHDPTSPFNRDSLDPERQHFLATCICMADTLANMCNINIQGSKNFEGIELDAVPAWKLLQKYPPRKELSLDLESELQKARDTLESLNVSRTA